MLTNSEIETVLTKNVPGLTDAVRQQLIANAKHVLNLDESRVREEILKRFVLVPREFSVT